MELRLISKGKARGKDVRHSKGKDVCADFDLNRSEMLSEREGWQSIPNAGKPEKE